jgi:hypothetical protein
MSHIPYEVANRISRDAVERFTGKKDAVIKIEAYTLGATVEALNTFNRETELKYLYSLIVRIQTQFEEEDKQFDLTKDINYLNALELRIKRELKPARQERPR